MGIHDGPELNRPYIEFTLDPDREPFPIAKYKVSDETYPSVEVWSDGTVRTSDAGSGVAAGASAIVSLTISTGATPDDTIANHADLSTYATDAAAIENNVSDVAAKLNEVIVALRAAKVIPT